MTKCRWLAFWLLFSFLGLSAQQLHWNHFRLPPSLSDAQPRLLFQRHNGLIYLATTAGLFAFDGVSFTPLPSPEGASTDIRAIFEDRNDLLVIQRSAATKDLLPFDEDPSSLRSSG